MSQRLPHADGRRIASTPPRPDELFRLAAGTRMVRVHATAGPRPRAWDELRRFGPTSSRFDHQTLPKREHPTRASAYVTWDATAFTAAIAEYFQDGDAGIGPIDRRRDRPAVTAFRLNGDLTLLDLDSGWVTRAGGNQAIRNGLRSRSREWARAIYRHLDVDGLGYGSSVWGPGRCVALWEGAARAFPPAPLASRLLDDPYLAPAIAKAAVELATYWV